MITRRIGRFQLELSDDAHEVAYLKLPTYPVGQLRTAKSLRLCDIVGRYEGPDVNLDFDQDGVLVGIEILC
jgi:hypothetical protein